MTDKQKLKSIERKMKLIQERNPDIDFGLSCNYFKEIERYYNLRKEHFVLNFHLSHCDKCGKEF